MTVETFHQLLNDHWDFVMRTDPLFATMCGNHRFNHLLPDGSEAGMSRQLSGLTDFRARLRHIDKNSLPAADQLNYEIFSRLLQNAIELIEFRAYRFPIAKVGGIHTFLPDMAVLVPLETVQDYENYIARLEQVKRYMDEQIEVMRAGLDDGQIPARVTLEGVEDSIAAQITSDPTDSVVFLPFNEIKVGGELDRVRLAEAAKKAIAQSVIPAFESLQSFLKNEYLPHSRESIAAKDLPNGDDYYRLCIRHFTSLELTPEEIHATGQDEVRRIRAEMEAIMTETGFEGDFKAFIEFLRTDPRFYAQTADELMMKTAWLMKRVDGELPRLFRTLPRLPYGLRTVPDFAAPGATAAYYMLGAGDGTKAGFYYVNTYDLPSRPLYEIEALSLHEAVPGHHLQLALQQELNLPNFRRFGGFTSFVEGWALYAERLGLELGFYADPYSNFGRLSYEMWRACRLVVDTGMHALGWSRQQAIDFMLANTSSTELNIINEVDRYIAWPGQALACKLGELKIRELRAQAEEKLGARFDIRAFHDVILTSGAVPLDVLEGMVGAWIESVKA